jgi:hypothetical protein
VVKGYVQLAYRTASQTDNGRVIDPEPISDLALLQPCRREFLCRRATLLDRQLDIAADIVLDPLRQRHVE